MAKKTKKKTNTIAKKASGKQVSKKPIENKIKKQAVSKNKKQEKVIKPKPKKASAKAKPSLKQVVNKQVPKKQIVKKEPAKSAKAISSSAPKAAKPKKLPTKPVMPPVAEPKFKGSPTQLSMALEEKETKPVFAKPRITRSKSGNLLFQLEYTVRSSPNILYEFLTTPSGMAQWFADSVDIEGHHCTFVWEGYEEYATIIDSIPDEYIRYRWDNSDEDEYFEFRISKNEITGDTILTITDFSPEADMKGQKLLWDSQIKTMVQQIGG